MFLLILNALLAAGAGEVQLRPLDTIHLRDPFILAMSEEKCYYLYGTGFQGLPNGPGFACFRSADLKAWEGPIAVFRRPEGFWADHEYWAPEVHRHQGRYYMFASFHAPSHTRGTQILVADVPQGPFRVHSPEPVTPPDWECLDGTLFIDEQQQPWIVFCHEWVQVRDGEICARRLSGDLTRGEGDARLLFHASEAAWTGTMGFGQKEEGLITDGPFLHRGQDGALFMLWSSFGEDKRYRQAVARSASGTLEGPWTQSSAPVFDNDGGHGMLFRDLEGRLTLCLHQPNKSPQERPRLFRVEEKNGELALTPL